MQDSKTGVRIWPDSAVSSIRPARQLSGDNLPPTAIGHDGSPSDPLLVHARNGTAWAHFLAGRYDEAPSWAERVLQEDHTTSRRCVSLRRPKCALE